METRPERNCPSLYPLGCFPILFPLLQLMGYSFFSRDSFTFVKKIVEKIRAERDGDSHQVCTEHTRTLTTHTSTPIPKFPLITRLHKRKMDDDYLSFVFFSFRNSISFSIWSVLRRTTVFTQWHHTHGAPHWRWKSFFALPLLRSDGSRDRVPADHVFNGRLRDQHPGLDALHLQPGHKPRLHEPPAGGDRRHVPQRGAAAARESLSPQLLQQIVKKWLFQAPVTYEGLMQMEYVDCVINESLRWFRLQSSTPPFHPSWRRCSCRRQALPSSCTSRTHSQGDGGGRRDHHP